MDALGSKKEKHMETNDITTRDQRVIEHFKNACENLQEISPDLLADISTFIVGLEGPRDISPCLKGRGFSSSRTRVSCFNGSRPTNTGPNRSYAPSTGRHREPLGQNVSCSIDIPVMADATFRADPRTYIKREVFHDMLAVMTRFAGGIPPIDFDEGSSVPLALVVQLANKLTPSDITDRFCQAVIFDHVFDGQTLHADHLVFVDDACTQFVLVVATTVMDTSMNTGNFAPRLLSVLGTLLFLCVPTLGFCKSLLIFCIELGVTHSFTSRENHHRFETQVNSNLRVDDWQGLDIFFHQDRDEVAIGTVFRNGDRAGLASFRQVSMQGYSKRSIHLGEGELTILPGESVGGIGSRLVAMPFLEGRILGSARVEVLVSTI